MQTDTLLLMWHADPMDGALAKRHNATEIHMNPDPCEPGHLQMCPLI